jgi:predicted aspartyl protease/Flp pilus assembly protein TadD
MSRFAKEDCVSGRHRWWLVVVFGVAAGLPWTTAAQGQSPAGQLLAGDGFMTNARYREAVLAYRAAKLTEDPALQVRAVVGEVRALHRIAAYIDASASGSVVAAAHPTQPDALAIYGDGLWGTGLFQEAEVQYGRALELDGQNARARHGRGRSLLAQNQYDAALADLLFATRKDPAEATYWSSLAAAYERGRKYDDSITTLGRFVELLPKQVDDPMVLAARGQVELLRNFRSRVPLDGVSETEQYVVPFRIVNGRPVVKARLNGQSAIDLVVDTGADRVALTPNMARRAGVAMISRLETAGVGEMSRGFRPVETARLDQLEVGTLRVRNVPCLIKNPALPLLPVPEGEVFSPLALGLSMRMDYEKHTLTMARHLPAQTYAITLPMRMSRLPVVRGIINGSAPAGFIVDTGGIATSVNLSVAARVTPIEDARRVPVRVYGMAGLDRSAFLMPFVDIAFARDVGVARSSVVVLNLDAPSALLGFQLGGIIGHQFLSQYEVSVDLERSLIGLRR